MKKKTIIVFSIFCFFTVLFSFWQKEDNRQEGLIISFLDVGQGDAALIDFPDNIQMLVDCAVDARIISALGRVMPFNDHDIDYLVITHPDLDHYGGCEEVLRRFEVKNIVYNGLKKPESSFWVSFWKAVQEEGAEYYEIDNGQVLQIGNALIDFLFPDKPIEDIKFIDLNKGANNSSLVFVIEYAGKRVLMTGDMEKELEEYLVNKEPHKIQADVIKIGHHGSSGSSSLLFLNAVRPEHAIISSGKNNSFGHPSPRIIKRLERAGANVWRTDQMGDIIVRINEYGIKVE